MNNSELKEDILELKR